MALQAYQQKILPLRLQLTVRNGWLKTRLETVIPAIMAREDVDMWLIIAREYNEDPVIMSMLPEPSMSARRRTMLLFARNDDGTVDRLTLHRYGYDGYYESAWDPDEGDQYEQLCQIIEARQPRQIALNISHDFAFGDGLSHGEYELLAAALGDTWMARTQSAERLCLAWLETRTLAEIAAYSDIVALGHAIIAEAFSDRVIHPGITTVDDVRWWMRQTMQDLGLQAWFHPDVDIQAPGQSFAMFDDSGEARRTVIMPGDLLWCDMGFVYLGLATDQQEYAYVLRPGENEAPAGIRAALAAGNQAQDIHMAAMQTGKTGNEILHDTLQKTRDAGLTAQIYSHPLGYHGHAAGPTIGLWDRQQGVPGRGDYEVFDNTAYSIELNVRVPVPEWDDQIVWIALEQDAVMQQGRMQWLDGRQTHLHLI